MWRSESECGWRRFESWKMMFNGAFVSLLFCKQKTLFSKIKKLTNFIIILNYFWIKKNPLSHKKMKCRGHKCHIHTLSSFLEMPWQYKNLMTQNDIKVSERASTSRMLCVLGKWFDLIYERCDIRGSCNSKCAHFIKVIAIRFIIKFLVMTRRSLRSRKILLNKLLDASSVGWLK